MKISWKWTRRWIHTAAFGFVCGMLVLQISANIEFKEELLRTQNMYERQFDSLVVTVTEHKPDRIFFDAYFVIQQHERMREHQLRILCKDIEWLYEQTGTRDWSHNMDPDEWHEALEDTSLLVNQYH